MKTFAVIGHPVGHSISPAIHHAAYVGFGVDYRYVALDCPDEHAVRLRLAELRRGELAGINVTVPWKTLALRLADEVSDGARRTGAANTLVRRDDGRVVANNTDVPALAERLRLGLGEVTAESTRALVLGNGGAARAAVVACRDIGVDKVFVSSRKWQGELRNWDRAEDFVALGAIPVGWQGPEQGSESPRVVLDTLGLADAARQSRLIVQATSAGMRGIGGGEELANMLPWAELDARTFLYDLIYNPAETPFLRQARSRALAQEGGLPMLVEQAALAIELWLARSPDRERMQRAANDAIFGVER